MKATVYRGPYEVEVTEAPDPRIEHPADAIVRITTTNIRGSDLHMYEGRTDVEDGKVLGHENMGIVEEVGHSVFWVKKGDRVSVPFNIACGICRNCVDGWTSFCLNTNPTDGVDGAAYGTSTSRTSRCSATSTRPGTTAPCSARSGLVTRSRSSARGLSA